MEDGFSDPQTDVEREIKPLIDQWRVAEISRLEQELFKQRRRLDDAERSLTTKSTKQAIQDVERVEELLNAHAVPVGG